MVKIILAFATDEKCARYASALETAGIRPFRCCTSASEVKRTMIQCGDALIIASCRLPDSTIDALAWDIGKQAVILCIGPQPQLALCEHPDVFKLPVPCARGELISAVNMLLQLYQMRLPHRTLEEKGTVDRAKEYLMARYSMTEPQAYRSLQKGAMDRGMKLADFAGKILETNG